MPEAERELSGRHAGFRVRGRTFAYYLVEHHHGWVGLRLDRPSVDWAEVEDMAVESYLLVAPKRLAASVREG